MAGTGRFVVGGNWKCNGNTASIATLVKELNSEDITADVEVICAPPMVYLPKVQSTLDRKYALSAQNCWVGDGGAFTGEVSADMLVDYGVPWVILGHSERRALCGESDEFVGKKVAHAISKGLSVMACIGETLEERESGVTMDVCKRQLQAIANEISPADWAKVVIAYEPVWAIGTGKVATPSRRRMCTRGSGRSSPRRCPRRWRRRCASSTAARSTPETARSSRRWRTSTDSSSAAPPQGARLRHHLQRRPV